MVSGVRWNWYGGWRDGCVEHDISARSGVEVRRSV